LLGFAGTFCRDIPLIVIAAPLLLVSLAILAALWRSAGRRRNIRCAT
jgi:hypothetical protein